MAQSPSYHDIEQRYLLLNDDPAAASGWFAPEAVYERLNTHTRIRGVGKIAKETRGADEIAELMQRRHGHLHITNVNAERNDGHTHETFGAAQSMRITLTCTNKPDTPGAASTRQVFTDTIWLNAKGEVIRVVNEVEPAAPQ